MDEKNEKNEKNGVESTANSQKILWASIFASLLLHSSVLLPGLLGFAFNIETKIDWLENYSELQGLSTESGRWAKIETRLEEKKEEKVEEAPKIEKEEPLKESKKKPKLEKKIPKKKNKKKAPKKKITKTKPQPIKKKNKKSVKKDNKISKKPTEKKLTEKNQITYDTSGPSKLPNISGYGPGNVVYSIMVRTDRIRGSSLENSVSAIMKRIPDYRIVLQNTEIDPVRGIDMLYIASAHPQVISESFLAIKHRMTNGLIQRKLDRRFQEIPKWGTFHQRPLRDLMPKNNVYNDPRKIFLAKNGLALLGKKKWLSRLYAPTSFGEKGTMMDTLNQIQHAGANEKTLALVTARRIRVPLPGVGTQIFETVKLEVSNIKRPKLLIELGFKNADLAKKFADKCENMKRQILSKLGFFAGSIRPFLTPLTCASANNYVLVKGQYSQAEVKRLLAISKMVIPNPPMLDRLPASPPKNKLTKNSQTIISQTNNKTLKTSVQKTNNTHRKVKSNVKNNPKRTHTTQNSPQTMQRAF